MSKPINEASSEGISRGQLIKGLGVGAAAATLAPGLVTTAEAAGVQPQVKVKELYRIYLSESTDLTTAVFSALLIPDSHFKKSVTMARGFRSSLQRSFRVRTTVDISASKLIGNRGHIADTLLKDDQRVEIFKGGLQFGGNVPWGEAAAYRLSKQPPIGCP